MNRKQITDFLRVSSTFKGKKEGKANYFGVSTSLFRLASGR